MNNLSSVSEPNPISETKLAHFTEKRDLGPHDKRGGAQRGARIVELAWNPVGKTSFFDSC